jgi:hypothetical protein
MVGNSIYFPKINGAVGDGNEMPVQPPASFAAVLETRQIDKREAIVHNFTSIGIIAICYLTMVK